MKPIFWVLLGILAVVVLFFGAAFITGIIEAIRGENPEDPETEKGSKGNAEQARAKREQKLREKIELAERDVDLLSGGSGYSMEEKLARGDISYPDHELYAEAKEKYIKKKSQ